jgi:beta-glucosidase-like glycosyl hydrolase
MMLSTVDASADHRIVAYRIPDMTPRRWTWFCLFYVLAGAALVADGFRDPNLPLERRVDDLVSRLTLEEKIGMLAQVQPAIPRLGIKAFTNWTEGLHGVGWVRGGSVTATTFPQVVGLGETWNTELMRQVGAVLGYESRVYFKKYDGARVGLAIRAPNVDLARDPRWGRTEESFGEDPFFVGKMSVGFIKGMQGDHPTYLLSASTMKHFLANSNEDTRTRSSSDFDERNLREYYLVPFQMGVQEANAQSFMASYNAVNKIPDTVSPFIRDIVEKEWKFDGMVCTDAGSLPNLTRAFKYYPDPTAAVVGCIQAGITVFLDQYAAPLKDALCSAKPTSSATSGATSGCACGWANSIHPSWSPTTRSPAPRSPGTARPTRLWRARSPRSPSSCSRTAPVCCPSTRARCARSR